MFINIGDKIRDQRTKRSLTQEKLAQFLGVSCRDVIKWESGGGYPELELLPVIASYFGITTDELLCMEQLGAEEKIKDYSGRIEGLLGEGKIPAAIDLAREALVYFPNSYPLKRLLMYALYLRCDRPAVTKHFTGEIVALGEDILSGCTDDAVRSESKRVLCLHFAEDLGDAERAKRLALTLPPSENARENVLPLVARGEDRLRLLQRKAVTCGEELCGAVIDYAEGNASLGDEERIALYELTLRIDAALYDGEPLAFSAELMYRYIALTQLYMSVKRPERALACLGLAADCAIKYDALPERTVYRGGALDGLESEKGASVRAGKESRPLVEVLIADVLPQSYLEPVRYEDGMRVICEKLAAAKKRVGEGNS